MAKKKRLDLTSLEHTPPDDLRLASLADGRLEGLAHRYTIILPLASEQTGGEVFSFDDVLELIRLLSARFGGCTSSPVHRGAWLPDQKDQPEADRNIHIYVYARQQNGAADEFFAYLKHRLKRYGKQEEIAVEKTDVRMLGSRPPPATRRTRNQER